MERIEGGREGRDGRKGRRRRTNPKFELLKFGLKFVDWGWYKFAKLVRYSVLAGSSPPISKYLKNQLQHLIIQSQLIPEQHRD